MAGIFGGIFGAGPGGPGPAAGAAAPAGAPVVTGAQLDQALFAGPAGAMVADPLGFAAGGANASTTSNIVEADGTSIIFLSTAQIATVQNRKTRLTAVGLLAHIDAKAFGFSARYEIPMTDLAPIVSLMRTYLETHPESYPGGTRAAAIRRVGISSPSDKMVMARVSGKLDVREKTSLALELAQTPNSQLQSQFKNMIVAKYVRIVGTDAILNTVRISDNGDFVICDLSAVGLAAGHGIRYADDNPGAAVGEVCYMQDSGAELAAGIRGLVEKHREHIDSMIRDADPASLQPNKRLRVTHLRPELTDVAES